MGGERARPMWVLLIMLVLASSARALCPSRCNCNDETLKASCAEAGLEVVPIQLNPEIRHIDLSKNKITNVHFTLSFYNNLLSLDLSSNKIQTLGSSNFEFQRNLKHLNLSNNEIETLSKDSFKGLRALSELDLSFNRLDNLPTSAFKELHSLEVLRLTGNQLVYLEDGLLKSASKLKELFLDDNQLLEMPLSAIRDCSNLRIISLSHNLLLSIKEEGMSAFPGLRTLELDNNVIGDIHPSAFTGLLALENLDLGENNFTVVPTGSLAKLPNLTKLRLSGNFFTTVPPVAFRSLFQLKFLRLDRLEMLTKIDPRAFVDNINLEKVWLDDNIALEALPTRLFHGNPRLTHISIKNNQLAALEVSHFPLDQLKWLKLGGNPLQCNCSLLWLWRLVQEQKTKPSNNESEPTELTIDVDAIHCAGPEPLTGILLMDTSESQVGCSLGWVAAVCAVTFTFLILGTVSALFYCSQAKKRAKQRTMPPTERSQSPGDETHHYEDPMADKYIIGPPLIHEYRALPPWESYIKDCTDIYGQYDDAVKTRPHIVYV